MLLGRRTQRERSWAPLRAVPQLVQLRGAPSEEDYKWGGAVIVDFQAGLLATAAHLLKNDDEKTQDHAYVVGDRGELLLQAQLVRTTPTDIAFLQLPSDSRRALSHTLRRCAACVEALPFFDGYALRQHPVDCYGFPEAQPFHTPGTIWGPDTDDEDEPNRSLEIRMKHLPPGVLEGYSGGLVTLTEDATCKLFGIVTQATLISQEGFLSVIPCRKFLPAFRACRPPRPRRRIGAACVVALVLVGGAWTWQQVTKPRELPPSPPTTTDGQIVLPPSASDHHAAGPAPHQARARDAGRSPEGAPPAATGGQSALREGAPDHQVSTQERPPERGPAPGEQQAVVPPPPAPPAKARNTGGEQAPPQSSPRGSTQAKARAPEPLGPRAQPARQTQSSSTAAPLSGTTMASVAQPAPPPSPPLPPSAPATACLQSAALPALLGAKIAENSVLVSLSLADSPEGYQEASKRHMGTLSTQLERWLTSEFPGTRPVVAALAPTDRDLLVQAWSAAQPLSREERVNLCALVNRVASLPTFLVLGEVRITPSHSTAQECPTGQRFAATLELRVGRTARPGKFEVVVRKDGEPDFKGGGCQNTAEEALRHVRDSLAATLEEYHVPRLIGELSKTL